MNADSIVGTVEFLHSLGVRTFAINGMIYSGGGTSTGQALREEEMVPRLIEIRDAARELGMKFLWYTPTEYCRLSPVELEIGAKRCNAGEYSLCVEPNGDVLPCQSFYASAGNLLRDPWERIWRGDLFRSFRDRELDPVASGLPEKCWECPDLPLCGGGCRIEREARDRGEAGCGGCSGGGCSSGGCGSHDSDGGLVTIELDDASAKSFRGKRSTGEFRVVSAPAKSSSLVELDGDPR
jgi:radical SAM protein with 4Fe4S-binding SPASM domain